MVDINALFGRALTLFIVLVVGFIAFRVKLMSEKFTKDLSNFVICVTTPFMIIDGLLKVEKSTANLKNGFTIILIGVGIYVICGLLASLAVKPIGDGDERKIARFSLVFANTGFMGFPVLKAVFGDIGSFYASFFIIAFNVTLWTYGIYILAKGRTDIKIKPINMLLNYGTIPCIVGIILYLIPYELPAPVTESFEMMSNICTPAAMFIVGGVIATISPKKLFLDYKVYYLSAIRLIALPLVVAFAAKLIGLSNTYVNFAAIMTALPSASNTVMYAERYDIAPGFGAKITGITTVLSVLTVPAVLWVVERIIL